MLFLEKYNQNLYRDLNEIRHSSLVELIHQNKQSIYKIYKINFNLTNHLINKRALNSLIKITKINKIKETVLSYITPNDNEKSLHIYSSHAESRKNLIKKNNPDYQKLDDVYQWIVNSLSRKQRRITDVILVGMGGSIIGPSCVIEALDEFKSNDLKLHFVSELNSNKLKNLLSRLNKNTTAMIVSSKSFNTLETLTNVKFVLSWFGNTKFKDNIYAITSNIEAAKNLGINSENVLLMSSDICGRFSIWSQISLPVLLTLGEEHYREFLKGAIKIDDYFLKTDIEKNIPMLLALLGIWYTNYHGSNTQAMIISDSRLNMFGAYLTQIHMESLGKSSNYLGESIRYNVGNLIISENTAHAQHSIFQYLFQKNNLVPIDFITTIKQDRESEFNRLLCANMHAQMEMLKEEKPNFLKNTSAHRNKSFYGGPSVNFSKGAYSLITLDELTPNTLGSLMAIYEYKVLCQAAIWKINPFDQLEVDMSKKITHHLLKKIEAELIYD